MIQINQATQEQLDELEVLVNNAKSLSDAGGFTFGVLQQAEFFAAIARLFNPTPVEVQPELNEVQQ